jgi:hypothetical protein
MSAFGHALRGAKLPLLADRRLSATPALDPARPLANVRNVASRFVRCRAGSSCLVERPHLDHPVCYGTGGLRYQLHGIGQCCSLNHCKPGNRQ